MTSAYPKDVMKSAITWRERLHSSGATEQDRAAFEVWKRADPRHQEAYDKASGLVEIVRGFDKSELPPLYFEKSFPEKVFDRWQATRSFFRPKHIGIGFTGAAVAASAAFFLFAPGQPITPSHTAPSIASLPDPVRFYTAKGEVRSETLSDGTVITLGPVSALAVLMTDDKRRVTLRAGEAFFDVTRDESRPFVVAANDAEVRVLGTVFEVRRRPTKVEVGVAEGEVEVSVPLQLGAFRDKDRRNTLRQRQSLQAGQRLAAFNETGLGSVRDADPETVGSWRVGSLDYTKASLSDVLADTSRYNDLDISIGDPDIGDLQVTTTIDPRKINAALDVLSLALPIEFERLSDQEIVAKKRGAEKN